MSDLKPLANSGVEMYEAPKVSQVDLDAGGNYVSPAAATGTNGPVKLVTLGNSIIE